MILVLLLCDEQICRYAVLQHVGYLGWQEKVLRLAPFPLPIEMPYMLQDGISADLIVALPLLHSCLACCM